jgi:hypothetical protein
MNIFYMCAITLVTALVGIGIMADMVDDYSYTMCNLPPRDGSVES